MYDKTMDDGKDIGVVCRVCMYRRAVAAASRNAATTAQFYVLCGFRELQWQLHNILSWCVAGVAALWETFVVLVFLTVFVVR